MINKISSLLIGLHPIWLASIFLVINYLLVFLLQLFLQLGDLGFNICLAILLIITTKAMVAATGKTMDQIGWKPLLRRHWKQLGMGIIIGSIMLIITALTIKWKTGFIWQPVPFTVLSVSLLFISTMASAYFQELAFRGYAFKILLEKFGVWPTQAVMAIPFGLMHLDSSMHVGEVASIMFTTGIGALLFGWAYIKTNNLALPTGIHFGWNYLQVLLPRHPSQNGKGLVKIMERSFDQAHLHTLTWLFPYAIMVASAYFTINYIFPKRKVQVVKNVKI